MTHLEILNSLNIYFPFIEELNASTVQERYFKIHYPDLHKYVLDNTPDYKWSERLYMIYYNIFDRPKCPICGNDCKFLNIKLGYCTYCSRKCISKSPETKSKKEQNSIKKWGVKNPMQSAVVKEKLKKTNIEKYGVECVYKSEKIKEKIKRTNIKKYGVEYALQNEEIKNKLKLTCLEKYGVEYISQANEFKAICKANSLERYGTIHPMQSDSVKTNIKKLHKEKYGVEYVSQRPEISKKVSDSLRKNHMEKDSNIIGYTNDGQLIVKCNNCNCSKCENKCFIIPTGIYYDRLRIGAEICTNLLPVKSNISTYELKIRELLDKYNIEYYCGIRNLINKELDIYIPSKNVAIEFNGIYWHCTDNKEPKYHINKFNSCIEKNIRLISIWEDQYIKHKDICESIILSKLGIYTEKIYARKCKITEVKSNIAREFYNKNHIQGFCSATVHYGLYYNEELVSIMSFGKRSLGKNFNKEWELIRYCSKINTVIVGGVSKLFKHFLNIYNPASIISWSSNDISTGEMYKMLGFEQINSSKSYWYIDREYNRFHRVGFSKSKLIKKGLIKSYDGRSETDIMKELGYYKIYDTGQTKWVYYM